MPDMNPFGSRDDDPLLQDDPLAPSSEDEESEQEASQQGDGREETSARSSSFGDSPLGDDGDTVFASTSSAEEARSTESTASSEASPAQDEPSRADLLAYLIENRAAIDVLFEMMAFDRADGDEDGYRHFLSAMRDRHEVATQKYREALGADLPETDLENESPPSLEEDALRKA